MGNFLDSIIAVARTYQAKNDLAYRFRYFLARSSTFVLLLCHMTALLPSESPRIPSQREQLTRQRCKRGHQRVAVHIDRRSD